MNLEKYNEQKNIIIERHKKELFDFAKKIAFSNNDVSVGDIIIDHIGKVKVLSIDWGLDFSTGMPECIYWGVELKKDNTPKKSGSKRKIYNSNIKK